MNRCITLLSDFGVQDASVAIAKGTIMQQAPHLQIIDISHSVAPFHLQQASYLLLAAYNAFPKGSIHILLTDIFSESNPRLLLCSHQDHFFLTPDNGLLTLTFGETGFQVWNCFTMEPHHTFRDWLTRCGEIAHLVSKSHPDSLGFDECKIKVAPRHWLPRFDGDTVECHVMHVDNYKNVVINLNRHQFAEFGKGRPFHIQLVRDERIANLSAHYNSVSPGQRLCRFNSTGYLEISVNHGNAADLFGLQMYSTALKTYHNIKVHFSQK